MATPRLFVDAELATGQSLTLPKGPSHHLATVLRQKTGHPVVLFNGQGGEYLGVLEQCDRIAVVVIVKGYVSVDRTPHLTIILGLWILKKDPMDAVLGRVVELGVSEITPITSDHCAVSAKMINSRREHWQAVIVSSCEQCGLNRLPLLHEPIATADWIKRSDADQKIIALPDERPLSSGQSAATVALLVGAEGGFSKQEIELASRHGFEAVTFGERILRAETAPAAAISVLHRAWGDF
ncbi:MAG: 16S rRNA (uracil(1498)-N(3))-methyltransferase [Pseudomonadales bacterium]|nr:16S rRNA (uracil(1498)-N(3))-methyltransferase [Pseudomonadales bacterium]